MDEATWRTTLTQRTWMLEHLRGMASPRKTRLFACACVRRVWDLLPPEAREAVQTAERYADGVVEGDALLRAAGIVGMLQRTDANRAAVHAVAPSPAALHHAATWALAAVGKDGWEEELAAQCDLVRCVFGNPFRNLEAAAWSKSETVQQMAQVIAREGRYADIPILADAIEDAGGDDEEILTHCRDGLHVRGCVVIDLILGRA